MTRRLLTASYAVKSDYNAKKNLALKHPLVTTGYYVYSNGLAEAYVVEKFPIISSFVASLVSF